MEGLLPHLGGEFGRVGVEHIMDTGTEMRAGSEKG